VGSLTLPSGTARHELAVDPISHRVYVTTTNGVLVVDGLAMKTVGLLAQGVGVTAPVVMPSTGRIYAIRTTTAGAAAVSTLSMIALTPTGSVGTVDLGQAVSGTTPTLAVDDSTNTVYANAVNGDAANNTAVVDGATNNATFIPSAGEGPIAV